LSPPNEEKQHGDVTNFVCLDALHEAYSDLEEARLKCRTAAHVLATIHETPDQVVELAYQQQSFAPLGTLFDDEEAALAVYGQAVATAPKAEGRWSALSVALAYEKEMMLKGQVPRSRMN
jgi:hypothetical protein